MTITINGNSIDFTLEKEKHVGEVMSGLAAWLDDADS